MPDQKRKEFQKLVDKFLNGEATPEEQEALDKYFLLFHDEPEYSRVLNEQQLASLEQRMESGLFKRIEKPAKIIRLWPRIAAAASIILAISAGGYFLLHKPAPQQQVAQTQPHDIAPGHNQATLTLAGGQKIILTKGLNGKLAQQGNTQIQVNSAKEVAYTPAAGANSVIQYNTLSTTKGEVSPYPLVLADGTKVWLNAESSISFPTAFNGKERIVKVTGEALFEVAHNAAQPFKVMAKGQTIEDIGTQFNINAYDDEPAIKTTLIEGSVRVNQVLLKPGQQSVNAENRIIVKRANIAQVIAWRSGKFLFDQTDLKSVMRQLARWYDLKVVYNGNVANEEFDGGISRDVKLSSVLKVLQSNDIHFQINNVAGKKELIITP